MNKVYLAIDYGRAHIGLAVADGPLATPLPPHPNDKSLTPHLAALIAHHQITHLIIGLPTGPLALEITSFAAALREHFQLPVTLHDETLSTQQATHQLAVIGASRRKKKHEHSYAAALILEDYLESATLTSNP